MKSWPLVAFVLLSGCLDEDIADQFVAGDSRQSLSVLSSASQAFLCVLAVYHASPTGEPPELAQNFEPWSNIPLTDRVHETSIEMRALGRANKCWNQEIQTVTGSLTIWEYLEVEQRTNSFNHGGKVALFDPQRNILVFFEG